MTVLYTNNATTTLNGAITDITTSITVTDASVFPAVSTPDHAYLTIISAFSIEIIKVTDITGNVITCIRGEDGTSAVSFPDQARVDLRVTKALLDDLAFGVQETEEQVATADQTVFTLTGMTYFPGVNNLDVYINGVRQYSDAYAETSTTVITFTSGLDADDKVKFVTNTAITSALQSASSVGYSPDGIGAVDTNVQAKLRETVSVKDFGATGDGTTDDTAAITLAITAAGANGHVFFPEGVYIVADDNADTFCLIQLDGQTWYGAGNGSIIRLSGSAGGIKTVVSTATGAQNYCIRDMQIDGNRGNITPVADLYNNYGLIKGPSNGKNGYYKNLLLVNSWGRTLETGAESATVTTGVRVENVTVLNAGTKAIEVMNCNSVTVSGCHVEVVAYTDAENNGLGAATSSSCFEVASSEYVTISGCHGKQIVSATLGPGIRLVNSSSKIEVYGCTIEGGSYLGFIQNVNDVKFHHNLGKDITGNGFFIGDADTSDPTTKCERIWVHHNTLIDVSAAYMLISAEKTGYNSYTEVFIHNNNFVKISGTPTYGIYNKGYVVDNPQTGTCLVYQWDNVFTGSIPNPIAGLSTTTAAEIQGRPGKGWSILAQSAVAISHTGTTLETTVATVVVPIGTMGKNGRIRVTTHWSYPNSANNKIVRTRWGGSQSMVSTNTTSTQNKNTIDICNRNDLASQVISMHGNGEGWGVAINLGYTTIDTAAAVNLTFTCALALDTETAILESYIVEAYHEV